VLRGARWAVALGAPADALVHGLKYEGWRDLAPFMAERMARLDPGLSGPGPAPVVVPVPTTPRRERSRGYNQARLLARGVARIRGLKLVDALARREGRGTQVSLHPDERRLNVEGAFRLATDAPLSGLRVLLIDDVLTTGATASAAAAALERGGVSGVVVLTFARSVPGRSAA
jgi:ComF family protein